jgi:hypothetical protein
VRTPNVMQRVRMQLRAAAVFIGFLACAGCGSVAEVHDAGEPAFHAEAAVCNSLPIAGASVVVESDPGLPPSTALRADPPDGTYVLTEYVAFDGAAHPTTTSRTLVIADGARNWHLARTDEGGAVVHVDYEFLGPGVPEEGGHRLFVRCGPGPTEPLETYPSGNGFLIQTMVGGPCADWPRCPVSFMRYTRIE